MAFTLQDNIAINLPLHEVFAVAGGLFMDDFS